MSSSFELLELLLLKLLLLKLLLLLQF